MGKPINHELLDACLDKLSLSFSDGQKEPSWSGTTTFWIGTIPS
jgi:hypothetical protein